MLQINASSPRSSMHDAAPPATRGSSADPAGFASLLRQTQAAPMPAVGAAPAPAPAAAADAKPATDEPASNSNDETTTESQAPHESDPTNRTRALLKGKLRAADGTTAAQRGAKPGKATSDTTQAAEVEAAGKAGKAPSDPRDAAGGAASAIDPSVMHWLAGLQRGAAGEFAEPGESGAKGRTDGPAETSPATQGVAGDAGSHPRGRPAATSDIKADADLKDRAAQGQARLTDTVAAGQFAQALAEQRPAEKPPAAPGSAVDALKDSAAPTAAALAPTPGGALALAAPVMVALAAPVNAPEFAQQLGLRLSVLARDGVQQAELHLNPAEMGPVSVQIVIDGTQARIDFGADVAATRHAIEAGLPELASALHDAGFTLAGGGVSSQAGGRGAGGDSGTASQRDGRRHVAENELKQVAAAARRIVTAGGVDVFA